MSKLKKTEKRFTTKILELQSKLIKIGLGKDITYDNLQEIQSLFFDYGLQSFKEGINKHKEINDKFS